MKNEIDIIADYLKLKKFAIESDMIEGENFKECHLEALQYILDHKLTQKALLHAHKLFAPDEEWGGRYRDCAVWIGWKQAPSFGLVPELMNNWFLDLPKMSSWEAHNKFEHIHPFQDGNGRMGRAIWLKLALEEGYMFQRSFLHHYYYQSLSNFKK